MIEEWREIKGYEGMYEVSNAGRVRNSRNKRIMTLVLDHKGYKNVSLSKNNKSKSYKVHRLVGFAFIENPNNYPQINHIDCDKTNNIASNLEWCTNSQNMKHARENKLIPPLKPTCVPVLKCDMDLNVLKRYNSIKEASIDIGCSMSSIRQCLDGRSKRCFGFKWIKA